MTKRWDQVQDAHDAFAAFASEMPGEDADKLEEWIGELTDRFSQVEIDADKKLDQLKSQNKVKEVQQMEACTERQAKGVGAIRIEKLKIAQFEGNIRKYPQFRTEFLNHIHRQCPKDQVAIVLKSYLTPDVREEVESCGEDYHKILSRLDKVYGDPGKLIDAIMFEIKALSSGNNSQSTTLQMIKTVEKAHRDLVQLDAEGELCNSTILSIIEQRMPTTMKQEWVKEVAGKGLDSKGKFIALMKFLENWKDRLEYENDLIRQAPSVSGEVFHTEKAGERWDNLDSNNNRARECPVHRLDGRPGEHPIWKCREFLSQPVEERIKLAELCKACKVCLTVDCPGSATPTNCRSIRRFKCNIEGCDEKHNRLLHQRKKSMTGTSAHAGGEETTAAGSTLLLMQGL